MPVLGMPKMAPVYLDEKGRISCEQVTNTMHSKASIDGQNGLHIVMATLCHYQCDSRAS